MRDHNNQIASLMNSFILLVLVISILQEFIPATNNPLVTTEMPENIQ
jgi:hypothetical protein